MASCQALTAKPRRFLGAPATSIVDLPRQESGGLRKRDWADLNRRPSA